MPVFSILVLSCLMHSPLFQVSCHWVLHQRGRAAAGWQIPHIGHKTRGSPSPLLSTVWRQARVHPLYRTGAHRQDVHASQLHH